MTRYAKSVGPVDNKCGTIMAALSICSTGHLLHPYGMLMPSAPSVALWLLLAVKDLHKSQSIYSISTPHWSSLDHIRAVRESLDSALRPLNNPLGWVKGGPTFAGSTCWLPAQLALIYGWTGPRYHHPIPIPIAIPIPTPGQNPLPFAIPIPAPIRYANRIQLNVNTYKCSRRWQPSLSALRTISIFPIWFRKGSNALESDADGVGHGGQAYWPTGCLADILGKLFPQRLNFFARVVGQQEWMGPRALLLVKFKKTRDLFCFLAIP